ncbi:MAG TPA: hypothetical protein VMS17_00255 [Gemmataceae bacterium]|nr:hypothetical protein [Gemmataceae bacterium]
MGFVLDAIKGSYGEQSEDRLTQVFCACFNNSRRFRELFLRFIRYKRGAGHFRARTQQQYAIRGASCRADILIGEAGSLPAIVVENKIDAPLKAQQLKNYNLVGDFCDTRKIALVKHYFEMEYVDPWKIKHWADFHSVLTTSRSGGNAIDSFVLREFVELLEELGMARALVITKKRLQELAQFIKSIREPKPYLHLPLVTPFETAADYLGMLEDIVNQMQEEPFFRKRLGKKARFSPWLGSWWYGNDAAKNRHPWLGVEISLRKVYKRIAAIHTGILFDSKHGSLWVQTCTADKSGNFLASKSHPGDLRFESYAEKAISFWKEQLM